MPTRTVIVRQNEAQWLSDEIRLLIIKKGQQIHRKAKQSTLEADRINFRRMRNYIKSKIRIEK